MAKKKREPSRWVEAFLSALLLLSFFLPWLYSMGVPVAAYQIRERLAGPHRLISTFTSSARISHDYDFAIYLYVIPLCATLILALLFMRRYQAWMGCLAGVFSLVAFLFIRNEVGNFPFHHLAKGPYLTLVSGLSLAVVPIFRWGLSGQRKSGRT